MAFEIKNPPVFTTDVPQWTKQTRANGEEMAKVIEKLLNNEVFLKHRIGRVLIGAEDTELEEQDTLFVVDASELPQKFEAAAFKNLVFGAAAPGDELWAQAGGESRAAGNTAKAPDVIEGKLSVSEQPASDADFFAKIND